VDDNMKLEFSRSAISSVTAREEKEEKEDKKIEAPAEDDSDAEEKSE
jgi:hypothetical protein